MKRLSVVRIAALILVCGFAAAQNAPNSAATPPAGRRVASNVIEAVEFRGLRLVPADTARALLASKAGATYNDRTVRSDFQKLWTTRQFDDIRVEKLDGTRGGVLLRFTVKERPVP